MDLIGYIINIIGGQDDSNITQSFTILINVPCGDAYSIGLLLRHKDDT